MCDLALDSGATRRRSHITTTDLTGPRSPDATLDTWDVWHQVFLWAYGMISGRSTPFLVSLNTPWTSWLGHASRGYITYHHPVIISFFSFFIPQHIRIRILTNFKHHAKPKTKLTVITCARPTTALLTTITITDTHT